MRDIISQILHVDDKIEQNRHQIGLKILYDISPLFVINIVVAVFDIPHIINHI